MSLKKRSLVMMAAIMLPRLAWAQFADVPQTHWAHDAVHKISEAGILSGKVDGQFHGSKAATRYDLAVALAKMLAEVENAWIAQGQSPDDLVPYIEQINLYVADEIDRLKSGQRELTAWMSELRARLDRIEDQMAHSEHRVVATAKCSDGDDCHSHDKGAKKTKKKSHEDHKAIQTTQAAPKKRSVKKRSVAKAEKSGGGMMGWFGGIFDDEDDDDREVARMPVKKRSFQKAPVAQAEAAQLAAPPVVEAREEKPIIEVIAPEPAPVKIADAPRKRSQAPVKSKPKKRSPIKRSTSAAVVAEPAPIFKNATVTKVKVETPVVKDEEETVEKTVKVVVEEEEEEEEESDEVEYSSEKKTVSLSEKSRAILQSYRERKKK